MKKLLAPTVALLLGLALLPPDTQAEEYTNTYFGMVRARDLSPFGFLRLDMRPTHALYAPAGSWRIETELGYQNTWALSPEVERYLGTQPRHELGSADLDAIRNLPGENYLFDFELAELDTTFYYKLSSHWSTYAVVSTVGYFGGFLDGAIEQFHDAAGFSTFGRLGANRNDANLILDLQSAQAAFFERPRKGGLLDPTLGMRYSGLKALGDWSLVVEAAVKVPAGGKRLLLSTGRTDYGVQATLQRFYANHAVYVSAAGVYYDGRTSITPTPPQWIPTVVVGYERRLTRDTHLILQGYVSDSVYSRRETQLQDLLDRKYQITAGVYHRIGRGLLTFAMTENLQNLNNTPDIGFQLGWAFSPSLTPGPR
jgi:hypothetical protein